MKFSLFDLLFNPNRFFQDTLGDKEQLRMPVLIVLAGAILSAGYGYLAGSMSAKMMESAMGGLGAVMTIFVILGAFAGVFIFWLVWAGVFYLISKIFKGEGSFNRCLEVVGYGYLPQVIGAAITLIAALEYLPKVVVPQLTSSALQDPTVIAEATKALMQDPAMMAYTQTAAVVSVVFLLWSANTWIFGLKQVRKLSLRNAAICVGVPVLIYVVYAIATMAGA